MARKTVNIEDLINKANGQIAANAEREPDNTEGRLAIATLLESVLHDAGRYRGFRYLASSSTVRNGTEGVDYDGSARHYF